MMTTHNHTPMTAEEVSAALSNYNAWRRGIEGIDMPHPTEIGAVIDRAVELIDQGVEMLHLSSLLLTMLHTEPDTQGALFKAENLLRELIARRGWK